MSKKLLREYYQMCDGGICRDFLTEDEKRMIDNGTLILTGVLQRADIKNGNGRIYPRIVLEKEVENYRKKIAERTAVGELDHPDRSVINLEKVSHVIRDIWWQDGDVMGKVEVLKTPSGDIAKQLQASGIPLGISSRGLGSVRETREGILVEDDFQLICFDLVSEPSTQGAFIMKESLDMVQESKSDKINKIINDILRNKQNEN